MYKTMFKKNYYYLVAGLPDLFIDQIKLADTGLNLKNELKEQLTNSDFKLAELLYYQYDNKNILNLLLKQNKEFINLGNYSREQLEEQIAEPDYIVGYLKHFILNFKNGTLGTSNLEIKNQLQTYYYDFVLQINNTFLKQWFKFDKDLKNIVTEINCRKYAYDVKEQLIPTSIDNEVYEILLKNGAKSGLLSDEIPYAEKTIQITESEKKMTEKKKELDMIKWEFLDEHTFFHYFSIEKILTYIIKLSIIEQWSELDNETGKVFFNKLISDMKTSNKFSEENHLVMDIEFQDK